MRGGAEWAGIIVFCGAWVFLLVWLRRRLSAKATAAGEVEGVNEASARLRAFISTALGGVFAGWLLYNRGDLPPQNAPLVWFFVALIVLWVCFNWLRWLRLKRR